MAYRQPVNHLLIRGLSTDVVGWVRRWLRQAERTGDEGAYTAMSSSRELATKAMTITTVGFAAIGIFVTVGSLGTDEGAVRWLAGLISALAVVLAVLGIRAWRPTQTQSI